MKLKIWAALIILYIVWGSTYLAIRVAIETIPPFLMAATRFLIAGGILYALRRGRGDPAPSRREWASTAVVGLLLLLGGNGGVTWAEQHVPSGIAALIIGASPLWMVLVAAVWPGRRQIPSLQTAAGVLIGFAGIVLLVGPSQLAGDYGPKEITGILVLLLGALLWSVGSLYSRQAVLPASSLLGTGMEMLAGGAGLLVLGTLTGEWSQVHLAAISTRSLIGLGYLVVFGSLVGYTAFTWLLREAPTPLVFTYAYVNPLVAIFLGFIILAEPLNARILIAALIIISSVALINTARKDARVKQPKAAPLPSGGDD